MNGVSLVISEDLPSRPGARLDHSRAFVQQRFIKVKRDREASETDIRRGTESAPFASFSKLFYVCQKAIIR